MAIRVMVNGANGRMGQETVRAVNGDTELQLVAETDLGDDLAGTIAGQGVQVVVDFTTAAVGYENARTIVPVELKSLKYYIVSFRNVGIFQEPVTARIYRDLEALLQPSRLCVKTVYNTRGGIDATCEVDSAQQ